ncbi:MAG: DUF86 domain-containing protein [Sphingobacteriales bacterium]
MKPKKNSQIWNGAKSKVCGIILVHEYFGMDFDLIWQVIIKDLPILKEKVSVILNSLQ